jgi:peptidoglycan/LPS O-acetylase OafA/YrhL
VNEMGQIKYRPDIDGLRALAVLPVVLFHAGFSWFPGGYVGVDVFFVISGYLITALIHEEMMRQEFSLVRFYERRIRRIFPALFVMLSACWLAAVCLFIPRDFIDFGKSAWAAALSVSNFLFWRETGYFDAPASLKPLLHTWSLGVEEQFYILFPLLLAVIYRYAGKHRKPIIFAVALLSFLASVWETAMRPDAAYYLLPSRAWELMAGSLLAVAGIPALRNHMLRNLVAVSGLLLILIPVFVYSEHIPFPGVAALAPVLGAVMLIHSGQADTCVSRILKFKALVFIGLISYSLYLWHWPIIVFTKYRALESLSATTGAILVAASFIAAWVSWKWVEQPFRKRKAHSASAGRIVVTGMCAMSFIVAIGLMAVLTDGLPQRLSPEAQRYASMMDEKRYFGIYDRGGCFLDYHQSVADYRPECAEFPEDEDHINVLIYGDSFAAHLYPGLAEVGRPGIEVRQYTATSCRPFPVGDAWCDTIYQNFFSKVLPESETDVILVSAYWTPLYRRLGAAEFSRRLSETIAQIKKYGKHVVLAGQSPTYRRAIPYMLLVRQVFDGDFYASAASGKVINAELKKIANETDAVFVDFYNYACNGKSCLAALNGEPLYWDFAHMTLAGSKYYGRLLLEIISNTADPGAIQAVLK